MADVAVEQRAEGAQREQPKQRGTRKGRGRFSYGEKYQPPAQRKQQGYDQQQQQPKQQQSNQQQQKQKQQQPNQQQQKYNDARPHTTPRDQPKRADGSQPSANKENLSTQRQSDSAKGNRRDQRRHNGQQSRNRNKRKPKNTTDFTPRYDNPSIRILHGNSQRETFGKPITVNDVIVVENLLCDEADLSVYDALLAELKTASGGQHDQLFVPWHGDSHTIANDRVMGGKWKDRSPTFQRVVSKIEKYFNMKVNATRFNWYQDQSHWKPYHHDRAAFTAGCPQNFTVAVSFGATREVAFQHAKSNMTIAIPCPNGSVYTFSRDVNIEFKHGVCPIKNPEKDGRISIIAWGIVEQSPMGSRVTENDVPSAKDLGLE